MKKHLGKIKSYFVTHKIISIVVLIIILLLGYWGYGKLTSTAGDIRYIITKVSRGTIIASVSGSGQVSALNQVDIKTKVSGDTTYVAAKEGQKISRGTLVASLDNKDARKSVRDAEVNLQSAQISLNKLRIQNSNENLNTDLSKAYDNGFNTISDVFLDLPNIMTGLHDIFFKSTSSNTQWNVDWYEGQVVSEDREKVKIFKQNFIDSYNNAKTNYDITFDNYKTISRTSDNVTIENLILKTYDTTRLISDAIKNANNYVDFVNSSIQTTNDTVPAVITAHKTSLNSYTSETNTDLQNLLTIKTTIKTNKDAFSNSDLDLQSSELSVTQKQNALQDAKDKLADYFIRAPFDGTLASINIKRADSVSAGSTVATLITTTQLAEISLNEVDVAKIKIGQKATLTFDAIPDLTISGIVTDMDAVGTVSQGVVTYIVKINFDTQDVRIKPGMSVSAAIITDIKQNILIVPNSAIKSQGGNNYIENFSNSLSAPTDGLIGSISRVTPNKILVEVGLSNDSQSEIISGIKEGDEIITRTIHPTNTTPAASAPSIFGNSTNTRGSSGGIRR